MGCGPEQDVVILRSAQSRPMRRPGTEFQTVPVSSLSLFNETPWQQLVFASWADASGRPRPDGSRTRGYVITLATEKLFGHGQEDDVSVME